MPPPSLPFDAAAARARVDARLCAALATREALLNETGALAVKLDLRDVSLPTVTQPVRFVRKSIPGVVDGARFVLNGARIMGFDLLRAAATVGAVCARAARVRRERAALRAAGARAGAESLLAGVSRPTYVLAHERTLLARFWGDLVSLAPDPRLPSPPPSRG